MANIQTYWSANAIQTAPDLTQLTSRGFPTNGNPAKGIPPTLPGAPWFYLADQRFCSVIQEAGMTINPTDLGQFLQALKAVIKKQQPPAGSFIFHGGKEIPENYLLCNGAAVSRTQYADLFAAIGTIYGAGDGSTTFNLPNAHHLFLEATTNTSEVGQHMDPALPNIPGEFKITGSAHSVSVSGPFRAVHDGANRPNLTSGVGDVTIRFNPSLLNDKYGKSNTVQPPSIRSLLLIRY